MTWLSRRRGVVTLTVAFVVSRAADAWAGIRFDDSALHPLNIRQVQWQLLDVRLLSHDLFRSIWYLHSQPPLYNLFCGVLVHLPGGVRAGAAWTVYLVLGLAMVVATFALLDDLGVARWIALGVALVVVVDPGMVLFENWLSWAYPTAAFMTIGAFATGRLFRTGSAWWAALCFSSFAAVVLTDPVFQWPWLVVLTALVLTAGRAHWRAIAVGAVVPLMVVAGWYVKNEVVFGTATTSSWVGMNLSHITLGRAPAGQLRSLVERGTLRPLAEVGAFGPVDRYVPRFARARRTGVPALDRRSGPLGIPNFDNRVYVEVSRAYLGQDLAYIRAAPGNYLSNVGLAAELWNVPADRYPFVYQNRAHIAPYARAFDAVVGVQPVAGGGPADFLTHGLDAGLVEELSWSVVVLSLVCLVLGPLALIKRRGCCTFGTAYPALWWTTLYGLALTSLFEVGENMRFRFELGTVPVVVATATVVSLVRPGSFGAAPDGPPGQGRPRG